MPVRFLGHLSLRLADTYKALSLYECLITVQDDIDLIWKQRRWTGSKVIHLMNRASMILIPALSLTSLSSQVRSLVSRSGLTFADGSRRTWVFDRLYWRTVDPAFPLLRCHKVFPLLKLIDCSPILINARTWSSAVISASRSESDAIC